MTRRKLALWTCAILCFAAHHAVSGGKASPVAACFQPNRVADGLYCYQIYNGITPEMEEGEAPGAYWHNFLFRPFLFVAGGKLSNPYSMLKQKGNGRFQRATLADRVFYVVDSDSTYGTVAEMRCFDSLEFIESEDVADFEKCEGAFQGDSGYVMRTAARWAVTLRGDAFSAKPPLILSPVARKAKSSRPCSTTAYRRALCDADSLLKRNAWRYLPANAGGARDSIWHQRMHQFYRRTCSGAACYSGVYEYGLVDRGEASKRFDLLFICEKGAIIDYCLYGLRTMNDSVFSEKPVLASLFDFDENGNDELVVMVEYITYKADGAADDPGRYKGRFRVEVFAVCGNKLTRVHKTDIR